MKEFRVSKKMLQTFGTLSLSGALSSAGLLPTDEPIRILFQQSTRAWRDKHTHGDPDEIIMPEYVMQCMCENVVHLAELGVKLIFDFYYED